jgi:uncharacterized protein YndB with AHSA1/START domain
VTPDTIHSEIFIEAGIDHVWSLVSRTGFWIGDALVFDHAGREGDVVLVETARYGNFPVRVERLIPPRYAAYRWTSAFPGAMPEPGNSTLVEFTLVEQDDGVLVRVKESGFAGLLTTPEIRAVRHADNIRGWISQLEQLRQACAAPAPVTAP